MIDAAPGSTPSIAVSVVVPAYNAAPFLRECLESVFTSNARAIDEVIVVDDGSTDATAEIARAFDGVRLVRLGANRGPSAARNAGVVAARHPWVAFLDADDLWPANSLAARLDVLQRQPEVVLVFGDCRQFEGQGPYAQTLFQAGGFGAAAWGTGGVVPDAYARLLEDNFITTGTVVARREVLLEVGGFAEDLRLVEDLDLWLRVARCHPIAWCPHICLLRRRHARNTSRDAWAMGLAFLEVLDRQAATDGHMVQSDLRTRLAQLRADACTHLATLALRDGRPGQAVRWAWRGMRSHASAQTLLRLARTTLRACAARLRTVGDAG